MHREALVNDATETIREYRSLALYSVVALGLALFVRFFIAAPYIVSGASMDPTFESWHYLIIDQVTYRLENPERGDVVVFTYPYDTTRSFIKRVIGLPGETLIIKENSVTIQNKESPEGFLLPEPYITPENRRMGELKIALKEGEYFVMGDNRLASADSRSWGALPKENIVGRALLRLYPFTQIGILPGAAHY